jgi:chromosome segregation ATPase
MDERIKIRELEDKKQQDLNTLHALEAVLGEKLLSRYGEGDAAAAVEDAVEILAKYRDLLKEIADSELLIGAIEDDTRKLREIEETITGKEQQSDARQKELLEFYAQLGEILLDNAEFGDFSAPYRHDVDILLPKIHSLEDQLGSLEDKSGGVFSWIGKNAQSLVVKSFLGKNRENLRRIYEAAGEKFILSAGVSGGNASFEPSVQDEDVRARLEKIHEVLRLYSSLTEELGRLKGEKRKLGDILGAEGNPVKRIQNLKRHITHSREELRKVYTAYGALAARPENRDSFVSLLDADDAPALEKIGACNDTIAAVEKQIGKLTASLAIDGEKAEIEKMQKAIEDQKRRIAAAEENIADLEKEIGNANVRIADLQKIVND